MKNTIRQLCMTLALTLPAGLAAQTFVPVNESYTLPDNEPAPVHPVPSERQMKWNETEFYAFFHYGINTYTGREWGDGSESESLFAPTAVPNPRQWLTAVKAAGMKGGIAVVKHHDGFCLWPTATTTHNVTASSNAYAKMTNVPDSFARAARDLGMKYGFYVSPWDRNSAYYGDGTTRYLDKVFLPQCVELAKYGDDQFEMWFDGANGGDGYYGGANTTRSIDASTYYDIPNLRDTIHKISPNCVMWGVGGEARWIGNEAGYAGETNWAMLNPDGGGTNQSGQEDGWRWFPGESDAKATTSGWFWHSGQGNQSAERLFQMYLETVGRNATLILNFPPNQAGVLPDADVNVLKQLGQMMQTRLGTDLAPLAKSITVSETRTAGSSRNYDISNVVDGDTDTYWCTNDGTKSATITFEWDTEQKLHYVMMQEYIRKGQRVKGFKIESSRNGTTWTTLGSGIQQTTIGYKRIIPLNGKTDSSYSSAYNAKYLRITITDSRACPLLHTISIF